MKVQEKKKKTSLSSPRYQIASETNKMRVFVVQLCALIEEKEEQVQ